MKRHLIKIIKLNCNQAELQGHQENALVGRAKSPAGKNVNRPTNSLAHQFTQVNLLMKEKTKAEMNETYTCSS